jgi:HD-GYP domain-containing protein (c-di-GMP phosphodiesterase class II)
MRDAISTLTRAAEAREVHATGHGEAVARYAEIIARELRLPAQEAQEVIFAARVHDVGKIVVPERILNKQAALSKEEFYVLRLHSAVGAQIVQIIPGSDRIREYVHHHHERMDGNGYPEGLRGEDVPLGARIIAVADAFATMTSERSFAPARSIEAAFREMQAQSGTQFDGAIVEVLARHVLAAKPAGVGR